MDFRQAGEIVDDDLNRALVNPLPQVRCQACRLAGGWQAGRLADRRVGEKERVLKQRCCWRPGLESPQLPAHPLTRPTLQAPIGPPLPPPPLPQGVKLHCVIDACHSGSAMDLPFQAHVRGGYAQWEPTFNYTRVHKGTAGGFAVQFSAAKDSQTAADTQALAGGWVLLCMLLLLAGVHMCVFYLQGA